MPPVEDFSENSQICGKFKPGTGPKVDDSVLSHLYDAVLADSKAGHITPGQSIAKETMHFGERARYGYSNPANAPDPASLEAAIDCHNGTLVNFKLWKESDHLYSTTDVELKP